MIDFNESFKHYILSEGQTNPDLASYIQSLELLINSFNPRTLRERRNLQVAKQQIKEIRRYSRKLIEENVELKNQIQLLQEGE